MLQFLFHRGIWFVVFFQSSPSSGSIISLEDLYKNWFVLYKKKAHIPSQKLSHLNFSVNFDEIWKIIHCLQCNSSQKSFMTHLFKNSSILQRKSSTCSLWLLLKTIVYCSFFFECERILHIIELILSYWEDWLDLPLNWSPNSILLKSHKHQHMFSVLVACTFWII